MMTSFVLLCPLMVNINFTSLMLFWLLILTYLWCLVGQTMLDLIYFSKLFQAYTLVTWHCVILWHIIAKKKIFYWLSCIFFFIFFNSFYILTLILCNIYYWHLTTSNKKILFKQSIIIYRNRNTNKYKFVEYILYNTN